MSISIIYQDKHITAFCANVKSIFRPPPAKDSLLSGAVHSEVDLNIAEIGKTAFQIILLSDMDLGVTDIAAKGLTCFSVEGFDIYGNAFRQKMPIYASEPWPFWCLLDATHVSDEALPVKITFSDGSAISFCINIRKIPGTVSSFFDRDCLARLEWLNSRVGTENTVPNGFLPISLNNRTISILGRDITVGKSGGIESIRSYFVGNNSELSKTSRELLAKPLEFQVGENGKILDFIEKDFSIVKDNDICVSWNAVSLCGTVRLTVSGTVEFDGSGRLSATIENADGRNISVKLMHHPTIAFAKYFMGLGVNGGKLPEKHIWKWDKNKHQDSVWTGSVNGGLYICPTEENPAHPFVNIYFHHGPKNMPKSWVNSGKGYFSMTGGANPELFYDSGEFTANGSVSFYADLSVSPFKLIDLKKHWNTHYYHINYNMPYDKAAIDDAVKNDCTYLNLHHGNDILPFLNYPVYDYEKLRELANAVHSYGLGFKLYYTIRELTTRLPELFALRSLRTEIFPKPTYNQGGVSWQNGIDPYLTENFGDEVIPAWKHIFECGKYEGITDPSIITNPYSRIGNFYVACIEWMIQNIGIDGLYIDDVGYGKTIMRRVRRVFDKYKPNAKIDFHSWNHFEDDYGAGYGHNTLIYMNLFPYIDSLWFGESFDYSGSSAEYLLTEISGIPFGLMGEMLDGDCNVWRGMLFGMTSRYPYYRYYQGPCPVPVWKMRKEFEDAEMIGFWEEDKPVTSSNPEILCTTYCDEKNKKMLCCFANFSSGIAAFIPNFGDIEGRTIRIPYMEGIQEESCLSVGETITLPEKGGIMIIIK